MVCRADLSCNTVHLLVCIYTRVLQHTAIHCNTLQHTATHCITLQHSATHYNTLQHTATHCNILHHTLQHAATHCTTLQHTASHCITLHHTATCCCTLRKMDGSSIPHTLTLSLSFSLAHTHTYTHTQTLYTFSVSKIAVIWLISSSSWVSTHMHIEFVGACKYLYTSLHIFRQDNYDHLIDFLEFVGKQRYAYRVRGCARISTCILCTFSANETVSIWLNSSGSWVSVHMHIEFVSVCAYLYVFVHIFS